MAVQILRGLSFGVSSFYGDGGGSRTVKIGCFRKAQSLRTKNPFCQNPALPLLSFCFAAPVSWRSLKTGRILLACSKVWGRNPPGLAQRAPGPFGPGTPKESERVSRGLWPQGPKECAPESEKSLKRVRTCVFGLFSDSGAHSLGTLGLPGASGPGTPFRTLFGLFWGSGPEGPGSPLCQAGGGSKCWGLSRILGKCALSKVARCEKGPPCHGSPSYRETKM